VLTNQGLLGIEAESGKLLWTYRRAPRYSTEVVNSPTIQGDLVYVTVGAGQGCDLVRVTREGDEFKAATIYANKNMTNHHGNTVLVGEHLFGFSEGKGWICQNFQTGDPIWTERMKLRAGSLTYADGRLYCYAENDGTAVLIDAGLGGWQERGRFKIPRQSMLRKPNGRIWTPPVVAGGKLFLRDQELIFCYDVKAKE
jgi:outer membrane protein assembly factor BamB